MITELIKASIMGAVPVALFTFLILQWSIASGRLERFEKEGDIEKQYKKAAKAKKAAEKKARAEKKAAKKAGIAYDEDDSQPKGAKGWLGDMFHDKVTSFGAGFYGTMAVLTYILIEIFEIINFVGKLGNITALFSSLGIELIFDFIINSIMNFIAAMVWFITLNDYLPIDNGFVWLGAAYVGYLGGIQMVTRHGDTLWAKLLETLTNFKTWFDGKANDTISKLKPEDGTDSQQASEPKTKE